MNGIEWMSVIITLIGMGCALYYSALLVGTTFANYKEENKEYMTCSKPIEMGSFQKTRKMAQNIEQLLTVAPRKPLYLNCSAMPKSLMCGSLNGQPIDVDNYHFVTGDNYDEKRICTLQSNEVRLECKNSNSQDGQSLQVQYQLPYNMDSQIQTESFERQGGRCA